MHAWKAPAVSMPLGALSRVESDAMERDKSLTIHQVEEVEKLVQDALVKLDQVQYALRTLEARLKDQRDDRAPGPEAPRG